MSNGIGTQRTSAATPGHMPVAAMSPSNPERYRFAPIGHGKRPAGAQTCRSFVKSNSSRARHSGRGIWLVPDSATCEATGAWCQGTTSRFAGVESQEGVVLGWKDVAETEDPGSAVSGYQERLIYSIPAEPYELLKPLPVEIQKVEQDEFIASFEEAGIAMCADSPDDSLLNLLSHILDVFDSYSAQEDKLAWRAARTFRVLKSFIKRK